MVDHHLRCKTNDHDTCSVDTINTPSAGASGNMRKCCADLKTKPRNAAIYRDLSVTTNPNFIDKLDQTPLR